MHTKALLVSVLSCEICEMKRKHALLKRYSGEHAQCVESRNSVYHVCFLLFCLKNYVLFISFAMC